MNITDFCTGRTCDRNAVSSYIRRHPELFEDHTKAVGKNVELDETAVRILDAKYPLEKPVVIVDGVSYEEHQEVLQQLANAQNKALRLAEELQKQTYLVAQAEANTRLLEDKEKQLEDKEKQLEEQKQLYADEKQLRTELSAELERLKNQTFWQRLFGR